MTPKFRAWLKSIEEMVEVLEIDFYNKEVAYIWTEQVSDYELEQTREVDKLNDVILMQYTGLKDKNGVEIYEGDIVNITQYFGGHPYGGIKYIVKRSKYNNNLVADSESGDWRRLEVSMWSRNSDDYEVIGNIYENPELLEELEE